MPGEAVYVDWSFLWILEFLVVHSIGLDGSLGIVHDIAGICTYGIR